MKVGVFLRTIAPDFMWCTAFDLLLMYEQIYEDCDERTFLSTLSQLKSKGYFITKKTWRLSRAGIQPKLYLRVK